MRTDEEIAQEILNLEALKKTVPTRSFFGNENHKIIDGQIAVLQGRHTERQIEREWYVDETMEDYHDGDNDEYHDVMRAYRWMRGDDGEPAPSSD